MDDGSLIMEVPSLILVLHQLQTKKNSDELLSCAGTLSAIYLEVVGDRVDLAACSNLLCGWHTMGLQTESVEKLIEISISKDKVDALYSEGSAVHVANIVKFLPLDSARSNEFASIALRYLELCFKELNLTWTAMTLLAVAQRYPGEMVIDFFLAIAGEFHLKL